MNNIFETISRENFKQAGYLSHPGSERRTVWKFKRLHRTSLYAADAVHTTLQRRKSALYRKPSVISFFQDSFNVLFR